MTGPPYSVLRQFVEANGYEIVGSGDSRMAAPMDTAVALAELDGLLAEVERLGNELAQERAKPGGSWDEAAFDQLSAEIERLREALEQILTAIEDANQSYERLAVAALARKALDG
jgi:uncharacterized protein YukE